MPIQATARFKVQQWDEAPYLEQEDGGKLTKAHVRFAYTGDLVGESTMEYLMCYPANAPVAFIGLEHIVGELGGRKGTFTLQYEGRDEDGTICSTYTVVPGSGTGELRGLSGRGETSLPGQAEDYPFSFEYSFADE